MAVSASAGAGAPLAGTRSDIPIPRERTPSPIRKVCEVTAPPPARDFDINTRQLDVIYAEDEEVFRETAIRELLKVGFQRSNIYEADDGLGALEHLARLQVRGNVTMPLVVLLDVRMPSMDGRECALQIQELVKKKQLRREPFVICISSIHRQVIVDEGKGNFQVVIPKPFGTAYLNEAIELLKRWWTAGEGRALPAWKEFNPTEIDVVAADDEPVCRLSSITAFQQAGVNPNAVNEVDEEDELMTFLKEAQDGKQERPIVVLLGKESWAASVRAYVDSVRADKSLRREPFVVCTSVNSESIRQSADADQFHAFLPRSFSKEDVKWCLEFCRLWWLTRGDGPAVREEDSASEASEGQMSEVSEMSAASGGSQ